MKVDQAVLHELQHVMTDGSELRITDPLDRNLYEAVNKVLVAAGGKWNRKAKAHIFDGDAAAALEQVLLTGQITDKRAELGAFYTPPDIAEHIAKLVGIGDRMTILEPSAGEGALAIAAQRAAARVILRCYEIDPKSVAILHDKGFAATPANFLDVLVPHDPVDRVDRVLMNPPFAKRADIAHITHAHKFLKPGGKLVSVASSAVMWRDDKLGGRFRELVDMHGGKITALPEGSFKSSGTMVNTCIVEMGA